jgi:hypothetical protein
VVSFTPRRLYPRRKCPPGTHWIGDWVGARSGLDDVEKRKFLTLPGLELQLLGRMITDKHIPAQSTNKRCFDVTSYRQSNRHSSTWKSLKIPELEIFYSVHAAYEYRAMLTATAPPYKVHRSPPRDIVIPAAKYLSTHIGRYLQARTAPNSSATGRKSEYVTIRNWHLSLCVWVEETKHYESGFGMKRFILGGQKNLRRAKEN